MDEDGRLQIVNVIRNRMDAAEIVDMILALNRTYKPMLFGIEAGNIQKSIGPFLNEEMVKQHQYVNVTLLKPTADPLVILRNLSLFIGEILFSFFIYILQKILFLYLKKLTYLYFFL